MLRIEHVDARDWMRPLGAPPVEPVREEPEPQDMGDALALDNAILEAAPQSYRYRWNAFLAEGGEAA